jgi:hypothetical protein
MRFSDYKNAVAFENWGKFWGKQHRSSSGFRPFSTCYQKLFAGLQPKPPKTIG